MSSKQNISLVLHPAQLQVNILKKQMSKQPNYKEAYEELQTIITEIEDGQISVDELSDKVKRAAMLIKVCKQKLQSTEEDVNKILKELEE